MLLIPIPGELNKLVSIDVQMACELMLPSYPTMLPSSGQLELYIFFLCCLVSLDLLIYPLRVPDCLQDLIKTFKPTSDPAKRGTPSYDKTIAQEMHFDLTVAKCSLLIDTLSHTLVSFLDPSFERLFVAFSSMTSLGSGAVPSVHSLALCISQTYQDAGGPGAVFGALSMLQAVGSMIIGVSHFLALLERNLSSRL